ncbi:MAG TPA: PLP-dependent aminotransferase family protein [Bryobacteraceae bacterium]|nr:PLP-dependent aminotransferase family protein [Bryobacteraceae bacterium]
MRVAIVLDRGSSTPFHRQIYEQWQTGILKGRFRRGDKVPSTRELAAALEVSRATAAQAYEQLIAEGYLESAPGSGTFVCRELPEDLLRAGRVRDTAVREAPPLRLSRFGAGLRDDRVYPQARSGVISFTHWRPDLNHFPLAIWRKLMLRRLKTPARELFDYADHSAGHTALRQEIAAYVARSRAVHCSPEQVIIVNGSAQGIDLCARLLLESGDEVAIENPCYQGARGIFTASGARLRPVPVDEDGIVTGELGTRARLVYVTPSHQFPTGVSLSLARRLELIEWARRHGATLMEDDYDSEYRYSGPPLPALQGLASGVPVIYIGTFSKVMFPALRIGYVIAPEQLVTTLRRAKWLADRHTALVEQAVLADFIAQGHLERHIRRMRRLYGRRREALIESLERCFGDRAEVRGDAAGMHVLVQFADGGIEERAAKSGVLLASARGHYLTHPPHGEFIFGFSSIGERMIREGVRRLAGTAD